MVLFILGIVDILGGAILALSQTSFLFSAVGAGMIIKGSSSIVGDLVYLLSRD